ncbi:hypothetical protein [Mesorhizobium shangrilense]|uniref:MarR family transcriptional regulator n=1 Tax=Mesorhizobium shangrilense TaxID=460060 RepID=A0ABV2DHP2_9HYPH
MDNPNAPDLALLLDRVKHVGKLLEHQLWQAALDLSLDKSSRPGRRFAGLVEAGAMLDATLLLVMLSEPRRSVTDIRKAGDTWACSIQVTGACPPARARKFKAEHADLPAAVLAALLSSHLDRPFEAQLKNTFHKKYQGDFESHDT